MKTITAYSQSERPALDDLWPSPFPAIGSSTVRPELTERLRQKHRSLNLNNLKGLDGEPVSRAIALLPEARERAGTITFEIEEGAFSGIHQCEVLGRGATALAEKPGWTPGTISEADGRKTDIYYAPKELDGGASIPGIYELRNIQPEEYKIALLNSNYSGEEALLARLSSPDQDDKPFYSGVYKHWYSRDPQYSAVVPVDMLWSERYQPVSQGAKMPVYEKPAVKKNPEQVRRHPRYYSGPYGRYGFAIHTDRWNDPETARDEKMRGRGEVRNFQFRDTNGCLKVYPDCLQLINAFVAEQRSKGRSVQLDARELPR